MCRSLVKRAGARLGSRKQSLFHICLFGLGCDGHTAALLSDEAVADQPASRGASVARERPETGSPRPDRATAPRHITVMVGGAGQQDMLHRVRSGRSDMPPAQPHPLGDLVFSANPDAAHE